MDPDAPAFNKRSPDQAESKNNSVQGRDNEGANNVKNVPGVCPVQKIRVRGSEGNFKTLISMLDTGSNTSLLSKRAAKLLGLSGPQTHLTMNLAEGQQRGEVSEVLEIAIESLVDEDIRKKLRRLSGPEFTLSTDFGISADVSIFETGFGRFRTVFIYALLT